MQFESIRLYVLDRDALFNSQPCLESMATFANELRHRIKGNGLRTDKHRLGVLCLRKLVYQVDR